MGNCFIQAINVMPPTPVQKQERNRELVPLKWSSRYLILLKLAVALLLALLIVLFWLLHQSAVEEQRSTLIADVLWLEQSIDFHLEGNVERLRQLAGDLSQEKNKKELFRLRSESFLKASPDIEQMIWLDASENPVSVVPTRDLSGFSLAQGGSAHRLAVDMARKMGKTVFSDAYFASGKAKFRMYSPVFEGDQYQGVLVGVYSFNALLKQAIPWWFAEKYRVHVFDSNGNTLASNTEMSDTASALNYTIPLDPPGFGLVIRVDAYRNAGSIAQFLLTALVIALALAVLMSLWAMRGHIQRRIAAEQAQRSEHAFRKAMEDSLTVGLRARALDGRMIYVNPAFCQMLGYSEEELLQTRIPMPYWAPEELDKARAIFDAVAEGKTKHYGDEILLMRKDGSRFDALVHEAPLIDADGRHTGWMASFIDVTARKRAEELARQQQEKLQSTSRLVTMGELASTLAHELNQPLAAITSYTAGCLNKLEANNFTRSELSEALNKLAGQAQRAGRIIRRVHDFVRKSEPKLAPCNLLEVIEDSIGLIGPAAKLVNIRIERKILNELPKLVGDRVMLEQVLLNLMRNAIEATSSAALPPERRRLIVEASQFKEQVQIRVIDYGPGISPEVRSSLFTPFFSTKMDGMGMGLNICRSIIELHRGRLWIEENPEGGTIIVISLPIAVL